MLHALLAENYSFWLPEQASKVAPSMDALFNFILGINIFFSSLIMAGLIYFVIRYRHRGENRAHDPTAGHSTALELTWTIIPTLLTLVIFYYGFRGYLHASVMPPNAYEITADGKTWSWQFLYPNGHSDPELHLVNNKPCVFALQSDDVIHDLFIPAFRMKKDVVPGRFNRMWVEPTKAGTYDVYCAMYCGTNHSTMRAQCIVHNTQAEFDAWLARVSDWEKITPFVTEGKLLYSQNCAQCHSVDGSKIVGPTWKDMYASIVPLEGGKTVLADDAYVLESIEYPAAKIVSGFPNVMPSFKGHFPPNEIKAITWYMKSISGHVPRSAWERSLTVGDPSGAAKPAATQPVKSSLPATSPVTQPPAIPARSGGNPATQ